MVTQYSTIKQGDSEYVHHTRFMDFNEITNDYSSSDLDIPCISGGFSGNL